MIKISKSILTLSVLAFGLSACSSLKKSNAESFDSGDAIPLYPVTTATKADDSLAGHWYIKTVGSITLRSIEDEEWPFIEFVPTEARFYGNDGCNIINGSYKTGASHTLDLSNIATTMKMCAGDSLAYPIANALNDTRSFATSGAADGSTILSLRDAAGRAVMTLRKSDIDFLNGAWQVVAVNGKEIHVEDARLVFDVDANTVSGNAGCNRLRGEIARNPQVSSSVQFSNLATTRMTCPDIETESALLIALEMVTTARRGAHNTVDLLDAGGHSVVRLSRLTRQQLSN